MKLVLLKKVDHDGRLHPVYVSPFAVNYIGGTKDGTYLVLDTGTLRVAEPVDEVRRLLEESGS